MSLEMKQTADQGKNTFHLFQQYLDEKLGENRQKVEALVANVKMDGESKQTIERMQAELNDLNTKYNAFLIAQNAPPDCGG